MGSPVPNPPGCSLVPQKNLQDGQVSWWMKLLAEDGLGNQHHIVHEPDPERGDSI